MARMMDDTSRAQVLSSLLSGMDAPRPQMGGPSEGPPSISGESIPEEEFNNPKGPAPSNGVGVAGMQPVPGQPDMVAVPKQLAMSVMQMMMKAGSANATGKSMGADGAGQGGEEEPDGDE